MGCQNSLFMRAPNQARARAHSWRRFFLSLRRDAPSDDPSEPARFYCTPTGAVYVLNDEELVGRGAYGVVRRYTSTDSSARPVEFCVKLVQDDTDEVEILQTLHKRGCFEGVVEASVLRCSDAVAEVGMRLYEGTLQDVAETPSTPAQAERLLEAIALSVLRLWRSTVAYCDIKTNNVLCDFDHKGAPTRIVLGDLGGAVDLSTGCVGVFTFPPRRSMSPAPRAGVDGIVEPREQDLVWGLGALLMSLLFGGTWVNSRFSAPSLRATANSRGCMLVDVFCSACDEARKRLLEEEASCCGAEARAAARCRQAAELAIAGWEEDPRATLAAFCAALTDAVVTAAPVEALPPPCTPPPPVCA